MADIREAELLVVNDWTAKDGSKGLRTRVVQWIIDGEAKSVTLEKREFYRDDAGEMKTGKAKGLGLRDIEALKPHWPKIIDLMKNPPKVQTPPAEQAADSTDCPF